MVELMISSHWLLGSPGLVEDISMDLIRSCKASKLDTHYCGRFGVERLHVSQWAASSILSPGDRVALYYEHLACEVSSNSSAAGVGTLASMLDESSV